MGKEFNLMTPIPNGFQIYESYLEVAGIQYRKKAALKFIKSVNQSLEWEKEPGNRHDPNAIKIFGISEQGFSKERHMLGYVDSDTAEKICRSEFWQWLKPRPIQAYIGNGEFCIIRFQIVGPKGKKMIMRQRLGLRKENENARNGLTKP